MAKAVIKGGVFTLGGQDYSAFVSSVEVQVEIAEGNTTNYAGDGWEEFLAGMKSYNVAIEWKKDFDLSTIDAAVWAAINGATGVLAWTLKKDSGALAADNPEYQGNVLVTNWSSGPGQIGQVFGGSNTWRGTGAITRDIVP